MNLAHVDRLRRKREMTRDLLALPKGDLRLLETPLARTLLESTTSGPTSGA